MTFQGHRILITGAGRGIGRALAIAFAAEGARVALADLDGAAAGRAAAEIRESGGDAFARETDLRDPAQIESLFREVDRRWGALDTLINNAGIGRQKSPLELSVEDWDDVLNTNLRGAFLCAREAARRMGASAAAPPATSAAQPPAAAGEGRGGGVIINIASTRALMSEANTEAYSASKGGLVALTHALAVSLAPWRIRVHCVSPGWIETGALAALTPADHAQHPAGRVGRPDDIARLCLFLADPRNDFLTAANYIIDGGMTRKMIYT